MAIDPKLEEEDVLNTSNPYLETEYEDGSTEYEFDPDMIDAVLHEGVTNVNDDFYTNLAEDMDENFLNEIAADVIERFEADQNSRTEWLDTVNSGLSLLGIEVGETNDPFPGACGAHHPLILESAVKFQAKASNELFSPKGSVKTAIIGEVTTEKEKQSRRVSAHMNYQISQQMEEYFDETENMLFYLPIVGSAFKKTYYDANLDRPISEFVPVDQFVVNYYASSIKSASCFTHMITRMHNDLRKDQVNGFYLDIDMPYQGKARKGSTEDTIDDISGVHANDMDEVFTLLEQYCYLDLADEDPLSDEDGIALPYVVTVEIETGTLLSIRRNWKELDDTQQMICPFTHYKFVPGLGFYGLGLIHLLGNLQMTLTSAMRSLVDSGTFANLQGGFVDKRLRIRGNDGPIAPGEYKEVESGGMPLKEAIVNLPFKEPSITLLSMFQHIEARGQKFADSTEQVIADSTNYGPVGTTMALLEASGKFFSGVHKRLHKSQKNEFKLLASINAEYLEDSETFDIVGDTFEISKSDYDGVIDVVPVSDPNVGSQAQKLTTAQSIYTAALQAPDIHDRYEVSKYYYNAIGVDDDYIDKMLPPPEEAQPNDPLTDLNRIQQGKPVKAFQGQDHDAHIAVMTAVMNDPQAGLNPAMQPLLPLIQANIQEHVIMKFKTQVAGTMAGEQPQEGSSQEAIIGQAAQKVAQQNAQIQELQQQTPDNARNKLADAELQRVINETQKLGFEQEDKIFNRFLESLRIQMEQMKEDNKILIAEMQTQSKVHNEEKKQLAELIKQAVQIQATGEQQAQQLEVEKPKEEPSEPKDVDKE